MEKKTKDKEDNTSVDEQILEALKDIYGDAFNDIQDISEAGII